MRNDASGREGTALQARADALLEIGRYQDALPLLQSGLTQSPGDARLLCRMAFAFLKMGELDQASRYVNEAVSADPFGEWGHQLRSVILLERGQAEQAVHAAEEAVALNPDGAQSLHALLKALLGTKQKERAEETAAHMRRTSPESVWTHNGSALAAMHLHEWERVEYHSRAGLALDPQLYSEVNNLGMALVHLGRYQEAVKCFREAARLMPTDQGVHQRIATARAYQLAQETQSQLPESRLDVLAALFSMDSADVKAVKRRHKRSQDI